MYFSDLIVKFLCFICDFLVLMCLFLNLIANNVSVQALPVGISENIEGQFRRSQILGSDSSIVSYMIRPVNATAAITAKKTFLVLPVLWRQPDNSLNNLHLQLGLLYNL